MLNVLIYVFGAASFGWVLSSMLEDIIFTKQFFRQRLKCWKCLTFWCSLLIMLLLSSDLLLSLSVASILSYVAYILDNKINRDKDNNVKL